ncbi:MAG: tyrosine-type recombinase/integrase [Pseudomonadota bacterium]
MLTIKAIEAAKPKDKGYKLADTGGLYLFVTPAGGKSWRANFSKDGKQGTKTYGRWPAMSLPDARKAHLGSKAEPELSARTTPTFKAVAKDWLHKHLPSLSNPKHRGQVEATLERFAYPTIGDRPIGDIRRPELVKAVNAAGSRVETAHRVAGRITAVFNYALDAGILEAHPAANLTRVLTPRKVKKPMPSIPPAEAGELMRAIAGYPDLVTRLGLELAAHTFVRVGELLGMRWDELKEDGLIWVVPADRMKGKPGRKLPHVVPLSKHARAIVERLRELNGDSELVLDSPARPGHELSENTLLFALYRLGYRGRMTVHGFRALASTVLNEQSDFDGEVIERQLAHKETDAVKAAYNRAQHLAKRRELMEWWGKWLAQQLAASRKRAT